CRRNASGRTPQGGRVAFASSVASCQSQRHESPSTRVRRRIDRAALPRQGGAMRAVLCRRFGPPETLAVEDVPSPLPGPGEVRVRVKVAGVNFPDALIIEDKYQIKPPLPFSPGGELAGVVDAVGDGVTRFQPGQPVIGFTGWGAFAEQAVV